MVINKTEVYKYDGSQIVSSIEIYPGDEVYQLDAFYIDDEDVLWMSVRPESSLDLELVYIDNQGWNVFKTHYRIHTFFDHDSLGVCFTSNRIGFGYIDNGTLGFLHFDSLFTDLPVAEYGRALFKKWDGNNTWFAGTKLDEPVLHRYVDGELYKYGNNDIFLGGISDIKANCNDVLYKAGKSNLEKFVDDNWEPIYPNYNIEECGIDYLELDPFTCELWGYGRPYSNIGCNSIWKITDDEITEYDNISERIYDIAFAPDGKLYTILGNSKLGYIDTLGPIHFIDIDSTKILNEVFVTSQGIIWIFAEDFTNFPIVDPVIFVGAGDGEWMEFSSSITPINSGNLGNIYEDGNGDIWFRGGRNLVQFDGTDWTGYPMEFGNAFKEFLIDDLGNFWIASMQDGLVYWDRQNFTYYNTENSDIFSNGCLSLEIVGNDLWIEHVYGLSRMKIDVVTSTNPQPSNKPKPQFTIYPNPTYGTFNIKNNTAMKKRYEVYKSTGEFILAETSDREVWSLNLEAGIYLVKMTTRKVAWTEQLIVLE